MHPETPRRSRSKTLIRADEKKMPVHVYGGSISNGDLCSCDRKINIAPGNAEASRSKTRLIRADKKKCLYTHTAEAFQRRYFRIDFRNWERSRSSATSSDKLRKDIEKSALKGFCPCAGAGVATTRLLMRREATPIKTNRGA